MFKCFIVDVLPYGTVVVSSRRVLKVFRVDAFNCFVSVCSDVCVGTFRCCVYMCLGVSCLCV